MRTILLLLALPITLACTRTESPNPSAATSESSSAAPETPSESSATTPTTPTDFSTTDLDLYARGITQEIALVKAAQARGANASTPAERAAAAQESWEDQTIPAAAKAASISEERYRHTRTAVHTVFETLDFQDKLDGPLSMDLSRASEDMKARLAKDPFTALTPAAATALRARMDALVPLWIEYVNLTAVAG